MSLICGTINQMAFTEEDKTWITNILDGRLDALEVRMKEHTATSIREMETKVISEFWKWGRTAEARYRKDHEAVRNADERLVQIEDRVAELERRTYKPGL